MSNLILTKKNGKVSDFGFDLLPDFSTWIDDIFNQRLITSEPESAKYRFKNPAVNIIEKDNNFVIEFAVPGLDKTDFDVNISEDTLIVSAEISEENHGTNISFRRREFNYSSFKRMFSLPETVDRENINAEYHNGILSITLPKLIEAEKDLNMKIKVS